MLETSREVEGYDGKRATSTRLYVYWWFEAWGTGSRAEWTTRAQAGRPPTPEELATADYIVFGFKKGGRTYYRTRSQGLDLVRRGRRRKR